MFNPTMIHMTADAIESGSHHCMYKNYDEYVVCSFFERDDFIARGFKADPSYFLEQAKDIDYKLIDLNNKSEELSKEIEALQAPKVKKKREKKMEEEGPMPGDDVINMVETQD